MNGRERLLWLAIVGMTILFANGMWAQEGAPASAPTTVPGDLAPAAMSAVKAKGKKVEYTGPNEIVELAPTPMLDDEGKQRLDPDGKPMFDVPVRQQRDKHGHPLFDDSGRPVMQTAKDLGYGPDGKKLRAKKEKPAKMVPVSISRGTLTVDGMTGKAALNYDIADLKYIYLYVPGIGVAVVSDEPFPGASEQKSAFNERTLTVSLGEHTLQIASDKWLLGKKPESAFVLLDREFTLPSHFPVVGYGSARNAPYAWPAAKESVVLAGTMAPPPPANLTPVHLRKSCPDGQMRAPESKMPGAQTVQQRPCGSVSGGKGMPRANLTGAPSEKP